MKLFENIEEKNLETMLKCLNAVKKTYLKDENILNEGDEITSVGLIVSGKVQLIKDDFEKNKVILAEMKDGETFAEAFVCAGLQKSPVYVFAKENTTVLFINFDRILSTCSNACPFHKQLIANIIKMIAAKNLVLNSRIELLSKKSIRERIVFYLLSEKIRQQSDDFTIPFSRDNMAEFLSADRSALSRELCRMQKEGIIDFKKNHFNLLNQHP